MDDLSAPNGSADRAARMLSRRQMLRGLAAITATSALGQILTACGGSTAATATTAAQAPAIASAASGTTPTAPSTAPAATKAAAATSPAGSPATSAAVQVPTVAAASGNAKPGGKVTWAMSYDAQSLAPFGIVFSGNTEGKELLYDSLLQWDRQLNVLPALADEWSTPDEKTYLFKLKKGVKFHSGKELDAEDVKYSVELQAKPPAPAVTAPYYPLIASVDAVDKYTAKFNMTGPDPTVLGWFAWSRYSSIVPKGFYESGKNVTAEADGTGPFKLVKYTPNDQIVLTKNADFWKKGVPYLDDLSFKILPDESSRVAALRSGNVDGADVSADVARTLSRDSNLVVLRGITSSPRVLQLTIKGDGKPWGDKRVRQAMSKAIDRQDLIDKVYGGNAELTGPIAPGYGNWPLPNDTLKKAYAYDPDGARKLLADAGFKDGFEFQINTLSAADYPNLAQVLQEQFKKVGIQVKIVPEESAIFSKRYTDGTFEGFLNGKGMRADPTGFVVEFADFQTSLGKVWFAEGKGWHNDELTKQYQAATVTLDQKQRLPQIQRAQELILDEAPNIYLVVPYVYTVVQKRVKDMYVSFTGFRPGLRETWLDK